MMIKSQNMNFSRPFDPQGWLTDTLARIADHKINRLDELMPWRYAPV